MLIKIIAISSTVALLVWMGFFMMGSLPLLVLKHDTPADSQFIRGLFNVYYVAIIATSALGAIGYAFHDRAGISVALLLIATLAFLSRRLIVGRMDAIRVPMAAHDPAAIRRFRHLHVGGMLLNLMQLALVCIGMTKLDIA